MSTIALEFLDLSFGYDGRAAVSSISGKVMTGSLTAVIGPNGSGKSTLLKGIAGILRPLHGRLKKSYATPVAYLPQLSEIDRTFPATVNDLVSMGLLPSRGLFLRHGRKEHLRIENALASVGLADFADKPISILSGGQMQRALFARVILQNAQIILLDEPFNAVDASTTQDLLSLIRIWHTEGRTVIAVIHDPAIIKNFFPESMLINNMLVDWGMTSAVLKNANFIQQQQLFASYIPNKHAMNASIFETDQP